MKKSDEKLYEEAEARVGFRRHFIFYLACILLIWVAWYMLRARFGHYDAYWPIYPTLGWGIGILSHYWSVFGKNSSAVEKEFQRLKQERDLDD